MILLSRVKYVLLYLFLLIYEFDLMKRPFREYTKVLKDPMSTRAFGPMGTFLLEKMRISFIIKINVV